MATFGTLSQMPIGSYPLGSRPVYAIVGSIVDEGGGLPTIEGIEKINGIDVTQINYINSVTVENIGQLNGVG